MRFRWFSALAILGSVVLAASTAWRYFPNADRDAPRDLLVQFLPWILIAVAAAVIPYVRPALGLLLAAATSVVIARLAGPILVDQLPNVLGDENLSQVFWLVNESDSKASWVQALLTDGVPLASTLLVVLGSILLLAAVGALVVTLRRLLLATPARSSFAIDVTLLVSLVILSSLTIFPRSLTPRLDVLADLALGQGQLYSSVNLLAWLLPFSVLLALMCRQGGSIAVGASAGAVVGLLALPLSMNFLAQVLGGPSSYFVFKGSGEPFALSGYEVLDVWGVSIAPGVVASVLLLVCLWWAFAAPSGGAAVVRVAASGAPVNWLSVIAFVLALVPFTSVGAIVLGHMSYDQTTNSAAPVRGVGLSRWAIVLGYLALLSYSVLVASYLSSSRV